jgi:predicted RNA binding protein YcfA (HicA-like mRNA interferase family)
MSIDYSKLRNLTARKLVSALKRDGFSLVRQSGSHQIYRHPDGRRVTISFHSGGQTFSPKILKIMIEEQAKWTEEDLKRLKILK